MSKEVGAGGRLGICLDSGQNLSKRYERQCILVLLCRDVNRGSLSHWNASLGFRSSKEVEKHWPIR